MVTKDSLIKRKSTKDPAPDWVDQTIGKRLSMCIYSLLLYKIISEDDAKKCFDNLSIYLDEKQNYC